jgi:hypothetical protein
MNLVSDVIGRASDFARWISVAQWASLRLVSKRSDTICLSNNSDVEVIGSLLLVHCVVLPHAVCLFLSLLFLFADEIIS